MLRENLRHVPDRRLAQLDIPPPGGTANPIEFMALHDMSASNHAFLREAKHPGSAAADRRGRDSQATKPWPLAKQRPPGH
jgi:hypothetical protein